MPETVLKLSIEKSSYFYVLQLAQDEELANTDVKIIDVD